MVGEDDAAWVVRVLIADDDARVRTALRTFLTAHPGFDVVGDAGSGAAALVIAREREPDVVVVDVNLPREEDGLRLLRCLTTDLGIRAVAISLDSSVGSTALAAGADRFLDKNGAPEHLLEALRTAAS